MHHAIYRSLILSAALVLIAAAPSLAQEKPAAPPSAPGASQANASASGELTDVDAKAATITVKTATDEMKFRYDDQTKVTGAQRGVAGLATMKGSEVTVQYKKEGTNNIATSIDVRSGAGDHAKPGEPNK
jgi:hypothetical protein